MKLNRLLALSFVLVIAIAAITGCREKKDGATAVEENSKAHVFGQEIHLDEPLTRIVVSQSVKVPVSVRNTSNFTWPAAGDHPVCFAYHWLDKDRKVIVHDGERTLLAEDLPVDATARLIATVNAPPAPGDYALLFTFVQEGVAWFNDQGAKAVEIPVKIEGQ